MRKADPKRRVALHIPSKAPEPRANPVSALATIGASVQILQDKFSGLLVTDNRHGDLQVMLSAARSIEASLAILIDAEAI